MKLFPALRLNGEIIKGKIEDRHNTISSDHSPDESSRGFSPDGKLFLTRKQALGWLKHNDIATFRKLPSKAHYNGLHSEHLAKAYGVEQKSLPSTTSGEHSSTPVSEATIQKGVDLSNKTAIVYDRGGLYLYCAEKLAEKYKKVMYYLADADPSPTSYKASIGTGLSRVKRIHDLWEHIDEADIVYFFDCYDGKLQHWLRSKGYTVFGSGRGEQVEIDKVRFLELLEELKLPCAKTYLAEGIDDLENYLKKNDGETLFLKNLHRGDFESRKFTSLPQSKPFLDDLRKRIGTASDTMEVLIQHKIDAECEVGYDGYQADGVYTDNCIIGYEIKDKGFVGKIFPQTPPIIKYVNDTFSREFKKLGYRGNYSTEIRIDKNGTPYYIDATCRVPSPPGELMCELYENWAESTWLIANGVVPDIKSKAKFGTVIILTSSWHDEHELHVKIPKTIRPYVKLKNHKIEDGEFYCVPNGNGAFFGAVVAWADTMKEAIDLCLERAEQIEADECEYDAGLFDKAKEQIESGEKFGIRF